MHLNKGITGLHLDVRGPKSEPHNLRQRSAALREVLPLLPSWCSQNHTFCLHIILLRGIRPKLPNRLRLAWHASGKHKLQTNCTRQSPGNMATVLMLQRFQQAAHDRHRAQKHKAPGWIANFKLRLSRDCMVSQCLTTWPSTNHEFRLSYGMLRI